jgi:hypothetical protein
VNGKFSRELAELLKRDDDLKTSTNAFLTDAYRPVFAIHQRTLSVSKVVLMRCTWPC